MLELYVFFFVIPGKIHKVAKARGESTIKWILLSWLSWLTIERECKVVCVNGHDLKERREEKSWPTTTTWTRCSTSW
jgi:hypothetical protein